MSDRNKNYLDIPASSIYFFRFVYVLYTYYINQNNLTCNQNKIIKPFKTLENRTYRKIYIGAPILTRKESLGFVFTECRRNYNHRISIDQKIAWLQNNFNSKSELVYLTGK